MTSLDDVKLTLVDSLEELDEFRRWLGERRPIMGLDIETTGLSLAKDRIRLVQFGDAMSGWAIPWDEYRGAIRQVLYEYNGPLVLQHAKFDAGFLARQQIALPWEHIHDTMIMSFLVDSMGPKSLKPAAALHVDARARAGERALKMAMQKNHWGYGDVPIAYPIYWGYGAMDTVLTARLAEVLWPKVQPFREAYDLELACERVLCDMELRGVRIDVEYCERTRAELANQLEYVVARLGDLNPSAPGQVATALVAAGAPLTKRTESGQLAVDDEVLEGLAPAYPIAQDVLEARTTMKLIGSYFDNFLAFHEDGILHPHINQLQARTGRMSITEPALQQVPRQAIVRDAFIPRLGNRLVLADYDNEELRVAAHFSGDQAMISAFLEGRDLHGETASRLYGENYTKAQRTTAKTGMFAKAYGAGIAKFAATVGFSQAEAAAIFRTLDQLYPGMARCMQQVTAKVRERAAGGEYGWVVLIDGRHLKVRVDKAYVGFNALIQGSCAVVLKRALVDLDAAGMGEFLGFPVHDEVFFDVPQDQVQAAVPEIRRVMSREDFRAPLTVSAKIVDRWGEPYREAA